MKKMLSVLPVFFFAAIVNAQGNDVGKGKTFGQYKGTAIIIPDVDRKQKPINGQTAITGIVTRAGVMINPLDSLAAKRGTGCSTSNCDLYSFDLKLDNGTMLTIGTGDNGFNVPKEIVGKKIIVEGIGGDKISGRKRRDVKYQQDIQFAATGIQVID